MLSTHKLELIKMGKKTEETIWLNSHGIKHTRYTGTFKWDKHRHLRVTYELFSFAKPLNPNQVENYFESRGFRLVYGRGQKWTKKIVRGK